MKFFNDSNRFIIGSAAIIAAVMVAYIPAMRAGFVWDDDILLTDNYLVKAKDGLYRLWLTKEHYDDFPLTITSLWLEYRLWGKNAAGYHVTNIALHAVGSILIWLVLRRLRISGAWLAALIFAVHPVNVASVAWISERKNTLSLVFYMPTFLSYFRFERTGCRRWYLLSVVFFFLALASKTSVVMLPFVLLLCAWWRREKITRVDAVRSIPYFVLSTIMGLMTLWFQSTRAIRHTVVRPEGALSRVADAGAAVWFYLYKALVPHNLMMIYPRWTLNPHSAISFLPGLILAVCFLVLWQYRKSWGRGPLFALSYHVLTLLPVLGFIDMYYARFSLVADHWQYVSIIGIIALVAGAGATVQAYWREIARRAAIAAAAGLVAMLMALTWRQARLYENSETLWRDNIARNSKCWIGHCNLGVVIAHKGELDKALFHLSESIRMQPDFTKGYNNMGFVLALKGRTDDAIRYYEKALAIRDDNAEAHKNLADALACKQNLQKACNHYVKAIEIQPEYAEAHNNFGLLLAQHGRIEEAIVHFDKAIKFDPDIAGAYNNLGNAYKEVGRYEEAIGLYKKAIDLSPNCSDMHYNLGVVYGEIGKNEQAIAAYRKAIEINSKHAAVHNNLAIAYYDRGEYILAARHCSMAIKLGYKVDAQVLRKVFRQEELPLITRESIRITH